MMGDERLGAVSRDTYTNKRTDVYGGIMGLDLMSTVLIIPTLKY